MRYKVFGRHSGLRVSELVLGAGLFGTRWGHGAKPDEVRRIVDGYADAGGNFIDTSDSYEFGESEELLGEFLQGRRDDFVLATKFTNNASPKAGILATGNSRKSMVAAAEASLKRLRTDRIDLYWVHMPDDATPSEEIVRGFDDLVRSGKVLYAGLSDFPAWRVARAATIAELRGLAPIAGLQFEHSLIERTSELDLLPMGQALGLGVVAWSPLGGGLLTGKYRRGETGRAEGLGGRVFQPEDSAQRTAVLDELLALAKDIGATASQVAIAWVAAKVPFTIIGPRTVGQLADNLGALKVALTSEQLARLDEVSAIPKTFPHSMMSKREIRQRIAGGKLEQLELPTIPVA
jgi:aryl-alcohol dehydrogenase-like predicted oxidoreductase